MFDMFPVQKVSRCVETMFHTYFASGSCVWDLFHLRVCVRHVRYAYIGSNLRVHHGEVPFVCVERAPKLYEPIGPPKKTYLKCCQISTFETVWHKVAYTQVGQIVKDPWISLVFFSLQQCVLLIDLIDLLDRTILICKSVVEWQTQE